MENIDWSSGLQKFLEICMKTTDKFAPQKKEYSRVNNMPMTNKPLSSAHMKRSRIRNCYVKHCYTLNRADFLMLENVITVFLCWEKPIKKSIIQTRMNNILSIKRSFGDQLNPLFSDKIKSYEKIILVEDETITTYKMKKICGVIKYFLFNYSWKLKDPWI